ncbi:MAG: RNA polymerase sigma factor [Planctomycetota bacterium]
MHESPEDADRDKAALPALLRRWFQERDHGALGQILDSNMEYLRRYAHGRLGRQVRSKADTGDVLQDAVVEFMRYSPPFEVETREQLRGLLVKIVDGVIAGQHRWFARMRRQVAREKPLPSGTSVRLHMCAADDTTPTEAVRGNEREAAVRLAIATLPPTDQRIVIMRIYDELDFATIGTAVDMKEDSARVRCNRAIARISKKLMAMKRGSVDEFLA